MNIAEILQLKFPGAFKDFLNPLIVLQDDGDGVYIKEWNIDEKEPSPEVLAVWGNELETKYKEQQVYLLRQTEYPKKEDLIVAMWEKLVERRDEKANELQALREQVKLKYPKI